MKGNFGGKLGWKMGKKFKRIGMRDNLGGNWVERIREEKKRKMKFEGKRGNWKRIRMKGNFLGGNWIERIGEKVKVEKEIRMKGNWVERISKEKI